MRRVLVAALLAASALARADGPCRWDDKACAEREIPRHPARGLAFWKAALAKPLEARIGPAPRELVQYIALDNIQNGIPNRPRVPALPPDFLAEARDALLGLPAQVTAPLAARLGGIYFVEDLGGTGFFDEIRDDAGRPVAGFTLLDPSVLQRTANAWATWKENTPFVPSVAMTLHARIQDAAGDTRRNAIQYILLHELGHMLAIGSDVHPSWRLRAKEMKDLERYPFLHLSWRHAPDRQALASVFDAAFPQRKEVSYYFGARLQGWQMLETYDALERTSFVTLYGVTNPFDDFAEAFASYVHVVLMRKPWEVRIERGGKLIKVYGSCWEEPRCAAKRAILERMLRPG